MLDFSRTRHNLKRDEGVSLSNFFPPIEVNGSYVVDTGHIVAFTEGLDYSISSVGGYKSLFFSGEGLVCRFSGTGRVWIQTRKLQPFLFWLFPFRPSKK